MPATLNISPAQAIRHICVLFESANFLSFAKLTSETGLKRGPLIAIKPVIERELASEGEKVTITSATYLVTSGWTLDS